MRRGLTYPNRTSGALTSLRRIGRDPLGMLRSWPVWRFGRFTSSWRGVPSPDAGRLRESYLPHAGFSGASRTTSTVCRLLAHVDWVPSCRLPCKSLSSGTRTSPGALGRARTPASLELTVRMGASRQGFLPSQNRTSIPCLKPLRAVTED